MNQVLPNYQLNSALVPKILTVGREATPVIVIDELLTSVRPLLDIACRWSQFVEERQAGYPGRRAVLPAEFSRLLLRALEPLIRETYGIDPQAPLRCSRQVFSLVTRNETELAVLQRVPHFDTRQPLCFALMVYLSPGNFGGTGFFRHRPTGYERITDECFPAFVDSVQSYFQTNGLPPARYCTGSDGHFELVESVPYQSNRLLIYPGNLLHSGLIEPSRDTDSDPASGRLTANVFFEFGNQLCPRSSS